MKKFRGKTRNNNKYLSFKSEFLIEIIVARNNCRLHLKWMLSCFKIIHFWLSSSPCLTEAKQFWNILIKTEAHSACFISSLWIDYVISFCRKPLENTQGFKMNTSFAIVFPINFCFRDFRVFSSPYYLMKQQSLSRAWTTFIWCYIFCMLCLLHLSSSIPLEVLQEDDWNSIVF